ncbi:RNA polymerase sigma factor [Candidatus Berkelbacteria bacterium]|nr:RNA polymerase sigma factor [Candidatus Berkelbacteria bacterium]
MVHDVTDAHIVTNILAGDIDQYRRLVERYEAAGRRYVRMMLKDDDDVDDVLQEAFIKAYRNLRGFDLHRPFRPWFYRILRNEALNWIRNHRRWVLGERADLILERQTMATTPVEEIAKKEVRQMIRRSLDKLALIFREPLALYYLDERSYQEISDILRIPMNTVATRLRRGKQQLRAIHEHEGWSAYVV